MYSPMGRIPDGWLKWKGAVVGGVIVAVETDDNKLVLFGVR